MKKILILVFCLLSLNVSAKEKVSFFAEDFANQSVYWVENGKEPKKCQAVRILPNWYLTAAHCVRPICDQSCKITVQLVSGSLKAYAALEHRSAVPRVFVPTAYRTDSTKSIRHDIALIHFKPSPEDYWYVDTASSQPLDRETFLKKLNTSTYSEQRGQWLALEEARPTLLRVGNLDNRHILKPIAVPDLRSGEIYFRQSQPGDFYYFTQLRHYVGKNFGVEQGMSGSGVILPGGDIIGIVSANINGSGSLMIYDEKDEPVKEIPYSTDYFLFTPLNRENISFIQSTIHSRHEGGKGIRISAVGGKESEVIEGNLQDVFQTFSSEKDITSAKMK